MENRQRLIRRVERWIVSAARRGEAALTKRLKRRLRTLQTFPFRRVAGLEPFPDDELVPWPDSDFKPWP